MKKLEDIMTSLVKNNDLTVANLELDAFSYPVPGRNGGKMVEHIFLYPNQPKTVKPRPYAWITVDSETGELLLFQRCTYMDFAQNLQIPIGQQVNYAIPAEYSHKEVRQKQRAFTSVYAQIREFAFSDAVNDSKKELLRQYQELQEQLINPETLPFYRSLSPEFYQWMETVL